MKGRFRRFGTFADIEGCGGKSIKCHLLVDTTGLGFLFLPPKNKLEMHHVAPEFKFSRLFFY